MSIKRIALEQRSTWLRRLAVCVPLGLLLGCYMLYPVAAFAQDEERDDFLDTVRASYELAEQWLLANQRDKGLFIYIYDAEDDGYSSSNNALRQLMASRLLAEISREKPELRPAHRKNLDFVFENWYQVEEDRGFIYYADKSKLGANAMLLRTLVYSPFYDELQTEARQTAEGILSLINTEDNSFRPWYKEPDYEYDAERLLYFYSGEALLSLVEYYQASGDERILDAAIKTQDFYLGEYVDRLEQNYYPAYVPWHTLSLNKLYKITADPRYAEAIFILNDKLLELQDTSNQVGRFYNPETPQYGSPHSSSDGVYTESLIYAYEIAERVGDSVRQQRYEQALRLAVDYLADLQYTPDTVPAGIEPYKLLGAFPIRVGESRTRVDNAQHAMDAFRKILAVFSVDNNQPVIFSGEFED